MQLLYKSSVAPNESIVDVVSDVIRLELLGVTLSILITIGNCHDNIICPMFFFCFSDQ